VDLEEVAAKVGTPVYVYSAGTIEDHYRRLDAALSDLDHQICYAVKANSNRAVLRLLGRAGAGFDIVSGGELFRVLAADGEPGRCTFAGVGKSREEIEYALEHGVYCFNLESEAELAYIERIAASRGVRAPIAFRVNPDVESGTHHYITTGRSENKFGIALDRVRMAYEAAARMPHIMIRGVQMHIGSQITEATPFAEAIAKTTSLVLELKKAYGIEFFSIGGGLGIVYQSSLASGSGDWWQRNEVNALTIEDYAAAIVPALRKLGLRILLEPGRFLVGNAGVLLTRVRYMKQTGQKKFAIVDAGMNDLIRPALIYSKKHLKENFKRNIIFQKIFKRIKKKNKNK
jgi:diaminopimelate decarboxylase